MVAKIAAILILLLASAAVFGMSRRWGWASPGRRPRSRHWITRLICGALGGGLVVAIAVCTIAETRRVYAEPVPMEFRIPTLPPPEIRNDHKPLQKGRFLLHVVIVSWFEGAMMPLEGLSYDLHWPQDADRSFNSTFQSGGVKVNWELSLSEIRSYRYKDESMLDVNGSWNLRAKGPNFSSATSGGLHFPALDRIYSSRDQVSFFSLARWGDGSVAILLDLTPVREEDPLKGGTFEDLLAIRGNEVWTNQASAGLSEFPRGSGSAAPAQELILVLQGNLLILLAAAILLAQLFQRRSLGFVKTAACLLLFVGALDRVVLRVHESRLREGGAPVEQRLVACGHLPSTAFFRKTALRDLEVTASDQASPPALRALARQLAEREKRTNLPEAP